MDSMLVLKNVPIKMTDSAIKKICNKFGTLTNFIRLPDSKAFVFISYATVTMAKAAIDNMKFTYDIGIEVSFALDNAGKGSSKNVFKLPITKFSDFELKLRSTAANEPNFNNEIKLGFCTRCNQTAELICERCGDYYCSVRCQKQDWINHRPLCFPLMALERLIRSNKNNNDFDIVATQMTFKAPDSSTPTKIILSEWIQSHYKTIASNTNVYITHIVDHKNIFIRSNCDSCKTHLPQLFDDIDKYAELYFKPLIAPPKFGEIYLACFDDGFYRVVVFDAIVSSSMKKYSIFFIDFGTTADIWLNQLSELSFEIKKQTFFLNKILLKNIPDECLSERPMQFLTQIYEFEIQLKLQYDDKQNTADLKEAVLLFSNESLSVNDKMIELNKVNYHLDYRDWKSLAFVEELPLFNYDIEYVFEEGAHVNMTILDKSKFMYRYLLCVPNANMAIFNQYMKQVCDYCLKIEHNSPREPKLNEVCLIKHPNSKRWYRAFCADPKPYKSRGKALMILLDYDEVLSVMFNNIEKLPECLSFPIMTMKCFIRELRLKSVEEVNHCSDIFKIKQTITFDAVTKMEDLQNQFHVSIKEDLLCL